MFSIMFQIKLFNKMLLKIINRIDMKGIPPALGQLQASFKQIKLPLKIINRVNSKGIPLPWARGDTLSIYMIDAQSIYETSFIYTWAIKISPNCEKYSLRSSSVLFHGSPRTIRSVHLFLSTLFVFAIGFSKPSSPFLLFSIKKNESI